MSVEIEVKFYVTDIQALKYRLEVLRARLVQARMHEVSVHFDTSKGKLSRSKQVLRLRKDNRVRLTYKGPSQDEGGASSRQEIEVTVGDFEATSQLLQALGYKVVLSYEKYRTIYKLDDGLVFMDELPYGKFIEIESDNAEDIHKICNKLGLNWEARIPKGYAALFKRLQKVQSLPFRDLTFANFVGLQISADALGVAPADMVSNNKVDIENNSRNSRYL